MRPPLGMASRALVARLMMDSSSWLASVRPRSRSRGKRVSIDTLGPREWISRSVIPRNRSGIAQGCGSRRCLRAKESIRWVRVGAALGGLQGVLQEVGGALVAGQAFLQQPEAADDHRQQVVEVVGHAAGEVPQGLHLLGLEQLLAGPFQFAFGFDPVGDVTGYLWRSRSAGHRCRGSDRSPRWPRSDCRPCAPASLPSRNALRVRRRPGRGPARRPRGLRG